MREILFRGKRQYTGEWAESVCPLGVMHSGHLCDDFIPDTVGQYAGIPDKNDKKIFEGDIFLVQGMEAWVNGLYIVEFSEANHCWWLRNPNPYGRSFSFSDLNGFHLDGMVVGNIHDNQDMLEGVTTGSWGKCLGYSPEPCPNCGRVRLERYENGKEVCEKCEWCPQDGEYVDRERMYESEEADHEDPR